MESDATLWAGLVGIVLPFLVGLLQHWNWPSWVNAIVFGAGCFLAAAITEWIRNGSHWGAEGYFHTFLVIVFAALAMYHLYWNRSTLIEKARKVGTGEKAKL